VVEPDEPTYMFNSLQDLIHFVEWLTENFEDPKDFEEGLAGITVDSDDVDFEEMLELVLYNLECTRSPRQAEVVFECAHCGAIFMTSSGLYIHQAVLHSNDEAFEQNRDSEFWSIIENSFNNHQEGTSDDLHNTD
jgi:hypothetical protein